MAQKWFFPPFFRLKLKFICFPFHNNKKKNFLSNGLWVNKEINIVNCLFISNSFYIAYVRFLELNKRRKCMCVNNGREWLIRAHLCGLKSIVVCGVWVRMSKNNFFRGKSCLVFRSWLVNNISIGSKFCTNHRFSV